ncbi:soluble quino protein glucose/sorbosone dehydrogenase [Stachybotrys elegans]|uniref:Soluble quino protein glucose/sorbosone dehydrogenase n=1 Tax=Stachybotrys elegans TaxID=80388 RepID=A0A8K0WNG1_9HYPO|nr:soluble quino protein glucose/sorbosone dehydrogenase [Stachybotrys elegans]
MALRSAATTALAATSLLSRGAVAQECRNTLEVSYPAPVAADGWSYRLVATNLTKPRGLLFDTEGNLLVVDSGVGLLRMTLRDDGGNCVSVDEQTTLVENDELNHGIELSEDGRTLYASSSQNVYSWSYNGRDGSVSDSNRTLVTNMTNTDHTTRTLLLSRRSPGTLLVSRGSDSNDDADARQLESGHAQLRSFNIGDMSEDDEPINYTDGNVIGWGLRNSVGVAEDPVHGGIWSVENSIDEITRLGNDIHQDNPGEELNFHGWLNGSSEHQGGNYGYPYCYAIWSTENFPELGDLETGDQFPRTETRTLNDESCNADYVAPRLSFQAHVAPLDIKFTEDASEAFVSFHGSWNREDPVGYRVSRVEFGEDGQPTAAHSSMDAAIDVLTNPSLDNCPDNCFRPAGLAWDSEGRLWMTSDSTGEIFVIVRDSESNGNGNGNGNGDDNDSAGASLAPSRSAAVGVAFAVALAGFFLA